MAFSEAVVIDRRPEEVFDRLTDLAGSLAKLRKSAPLEIERLSGGGELTAGAAWRISGETRLGRRTGRVEITGMSPPDHLAFLSTGRGFALNTVITISAAGASRSRLEAANELFAMTFGARLLAPAIRLTRRRVVKGLRKGLRRLKKRLEVEPAPASGA